MKDNGLDLESVQKKKYHRTKLNKDKCLKFIESNSVTSFMTVITMYALYSDDVRVLGFEKSADLAFVILSSIAFFLFVFEIILQCWCRERYLNFPKRKDLSCLKGPWKDKIESVKSLLFIGSFYFWLDLMATVSMVFELPWIISPTADGVDESFDNARAGKASRAGAKAARILRIVRMIRLVRLVRLYKYFSGSKQKNETIVPIPEDGEMDDIPPESHVGAEMSDRTTKKVIVGILIMLVVIPLLQVNEMEYINEYGMHMVLERRVRIYEDSMKSLVESDWSSWQYVEQYFVNQTTCIELSYEGFDTLDESSITFPTSRSDPSSLRQSEKKVISIMKTSQDTEQNKIFTMTALFDESSKAKEEAILGILLTSFVILLLAVGTMTFSRDVNSLVIIPIEKMVQLVREISANPLGKKYSLSQNEIKGSDDGMETTLLLRTISKIAGLMRIGFGEAGAEIICRNLNMSSEENGGASINLLGNGTKILSIFGFCDVRNFTDTTECLQEEVMLFVNRIAHILHSIVVQCDGAANKNIGDAFLLTWKIEPSKLNSCEDHDYAADKALYSFLKTIVSMIRHEDFICNFSPTSLGALYERMPGYKCRIGCGLHFGWAVEGAIGSDKKIDASYISPHVNWAEFLESSTKTYDVPILLSEPFLKLLSPNVTKYCRRIDVIKKSATDEVVTLYTYDTNLDIEVEKEKIVHHPLPDERSQRRTQLLNRRITGSTFSTRISGTSEHRDYKLESMIKSSNQKSNIRPVGEPPEIILPPFTVQVWEEDEDMLHLREHFTADMRSLWDKGFDAYISGDWNTAMKHFQNVLLMSGYKDGPSIHLLNLINEHSCRPPKDWSGFRVLDP